MTVTLRWKLALLLLAGCCCAPSQTPSQKVVALGSVVESQKPCPAGLIVGTACQQLQVICPELRPLPVQIRITEPAGGVPFRGTVVMGSGGNGAGFYAGPEGGRILVREIAAMGFRVVDKAWEGGTNTFEGGLKKQSCHYAALLTWIHDHIHKQGKFVATGNSGGSADIGYADYLGARRHSRCGDPHLRAASEPPGLCVCQTGVAGVGVAMREHRPKRRDGVHTGMYSRAAQEPCRVFCVQDRSMQASKSGRNARATS